MCVENNYLPRWNKGLLLAPYSFIPKNGVTLIRDIVTSLIDFMFPGVESVYDPTCGEANYIFSDYLRGRIDGTLNGWLLYLPCTRRLVKYYASDIKKTKWNCHDGECIFYDVLSNEPPPIKADIIFYDPPYLPLAIEHKRSKKYGMDRTYSVEQIKQYYAPSIIGRLASATNMGIVIKGQDFHVPYKSDNMYSFIGDIIDLSDYRKHGLKLRGIIIYEFARSNLPLVRWRISNSMAKRGFRRPISKNGYLVFLGKA